MNVEINNNLVLSDLLLPQGLWLAKGASDIGLVQAKLI